MQSLTPPGGGVSIRDGYRQGNPGVLPFRNLKLKSSRGQSMNKDQLRDSCILNRRSLLKGGALAGVAAMAGLTACQRQAETVVEQTPAQPEAASTEATRNMHLSLAAYSVRQALTDGQMDLFQFIDWCAELGLPGTELTSYYFKEGFDAAYLRQLKLHAFRSGVTVSGTAIRNDFCMPAGEKKSQEIAQVRQWIDYAAELSAPHIRIFAGQQPEGSTKEQAIQWVADGIKEVLPYAAERGILLGLENHGGITALVEDHLAILQAVGEHPWFGINLDTGNYRTSPYESLAKAAPYAVNVQIKVEVYEGEQKQQADLTRFRDILVETGYQGWVALEYEAEEDAKVAVPRYIGQMQELF